MLAMTLLLAQPGFGYADEAPERIVSTPVPVQSASTDLLIRQSDERYSAGKRAVQEGRLEDARRDFNRAVEILLTSTGNAADQITLERHLDNLVDSVYRFDLDRLGAGATEESAYEKSPIE